jgi:hypothetical protein
MSEDNKVIMAVIVVVGFIAFFGLITDGINDEQKIKAMVECVSKHTPEQCASLFKGK